MFGCSNKVLQLMFAPADDTGGAPLNSDAILDILNDDSNDDIDDGEIDLSERKTPKAKKSEEDEEEDKPAKKVVSSEDEDTESDKDDEDEDDDLSELEEELEGPQDEDLELVTPVRRAEILKKYPTLFKDFPYLEKAYYREQKYTELLPTIKDAETAVEKSQLLDTFEKKLYAGENDVILKAVKAEDPEAFNKLVDNYLPSLRATDEKAYFHVLGNVIKGTIYNMVKEGRETENEALQNAAQILNQFVFGTSKFIPATKLAKETSDKENPEAAELKKKQEEFTQRQFETARDGLHNRVESVLTKAISKHIDPRGSMTDYVRKHATNEAYETVTKLLSSDTRFRAVLDKAWKNAFENNFDTDSMEKVRKTIISRAQTLLPSVIKKARNEALRGIGKRVRADETEEDTDNDSTGRPTSSTNRGPLKKTEKGASNNSGSVRRGEIPKGMSSKDFIMAD